MPPTFPHTAVTSRPATSRSSTTSRSIACRSEMNRFPPASLAWLRRLVQITLLFTARISTPRSAHQARWRDSRSIMLASATNVSALGDQHCSSTCDGHGSRSCEDPSSDSRSKSCPGVSAAPPTSARAQASPSAMSLCETRSFESPRSSRRRLGGRRARTRAPCSVTLARTAVTTRGPSRAPRPFSRARE